MPNPTGKNSQGKKEYPPDDVLEASLRKYVTRGLSQNDKLKRLVDDHHLSIGLSKLNQLERKFNIPSLRRCAPSVDIVRQAVVDEVDKDVAQRNGPAFVTGKLRLMGIMTPRDTVRKIMHEYYPEGFDVRFPGKVRPKIPRGTLTAIGPYHEVSADGHEKIAQQALKMGEVGISIYGWKDKWSSAALWVVAVPDCRSAGAIGHLYLDFIERIGGIPLQITVDKGSETGWQCAIQYALREVFAPDVDEDTYPPFVALKSVHNVAIEGFWHWLRQGTGLSLKEILLRGKTEQLFSPSVGLHKDLFNWIFPPLVQVALDDFCTAWNHHHIRQQPDKDMPSDHVPIDALEHPQYLAGLDCRIPIPAEVIGHLREFLTEQVGPREAYLQWVTEEFSQRAHEVHTSLRMPTITLENAWDIFVKMSDAMS
ncbi:hypothetical protein PC9H_000434 [Pleurotus ostreatus]|uniref:Integrase core domain-containing protein n=1 Tax=Pleurotus ostreatus TaxID=5322 RepID=A0A8H7DZC6_PLEOS|nr:uncharacterized protein PC9H_000434 [Pleurotus ostreatus]KAF7440091.1 hypothetical protein PC9H_000434 [Pleurotus ostreatus]KAJ8700652.1 hypothetical protein PTI98_003661 [Pleurotus ostreatus]